MLSTEMPSLDTKRDKQKLPESQHISKIQQTFIPTFRDCLVIAITSLVVLVFCSALMLGASKILHAGTIGWIATLVAIFFAVIIINLIMLLSYFHFK